MWDQPPIERRSANFVRWDPRVDTFVDEDIFCGNYTRLSRDDRMLTCRCNGHPSAGLLMEARTRLREKARGYLEGGVPEDEAPMALEDEVLGSDRVGPSGAASSTDVLLAHGA